MSLFPTPNQGVAGKFPTPWNRESCSFDQGKYVCNGVEHSSRWSVSTFPRSPPEQRSHDHHSTTSQKADRETLAAHKGEQDAEIDGRYYETPKMSPSAIVAIAIVARPQTILRSQRIPEA